MHEIEYKLKFLLNSLTLKIVDIVDISNPKEVLLFNTKNCNTVKIHGFCDRIAESTYFPNMGVPINKSNTLHKVLFCEIAVGESIVVFKEHAESLDTPNGINSFMVGNDDQLGYLSDRSIVSTDFNYVIKNRSLILPLYEVTFEYDEKLEAASRNSDICQKCLKFNSVMFCPAERAYFCQDCDSNIHCDDFLRRHRRLYFKEVGQKKFLCCPHHHGYVVEYFCETCMEGICTECKIHGSHSSREFSDHKIITFLNACSMLKIRVDETSEPIELLREKCEDDIESYKSKISQFRGNIKDLRLYVENEFKNITNQINSIETSQRQRINAKYLNRVSRMDYIERVLSYPNEMDPADLIGTYKNIEEQRRTEKEVILPNEEIESVEAVGKMSIRMAHSAEPRIPISEGKDKASQWRIETMHISKEKFDLINK